MDILDHAAPLLARYRAVLCDVWGVVHNGRDVYRGAVDALEGFRAGGGRVLLLTNAPRPAASVERQLDTLGVPRTAWDAVVTSGDAMRDTLARAAHRTLFHLGPDRDLPLIDGLNVQLVGLEDAEAVLCTGLFDDETETPEDYVQLLAEMQARGLTMYCANPDIVVHRGDDLVYCAGALAQRYREQGGTVVLAGKPHAPIYRLAFATLERLCGAPVDAAQVLAVGDGVPTDVAGAADAGLDVLFVTGGIHGTEVGARHTEPDPERLAGFVDEVRTAIPGLRLVAAQPRLAP